MFQRNSIVNEDCMEVFKCLESDVFDLSLTDIPYGFVNKTSNGLRTIDKKCANTTTFDLLDFLQEIYRVTKGTVIIFCAKEQLSEIYAFFAQKQNEGKGTVRQIIWNKTNPSPMNGKYIYLSGIENAVWFKNRGGVFNAYCKNTVFSYPNGKSKLHPTEKNHDLLRELILDNSNEGDYVFDPCCGSGAHLLVAAEENRNYFGIEINRDYFNLASNRLDTYKDI